MMQSEKKTGHTLPMKTCLSIFLFFFLSLGVSTLAYAQVSVPTTEKEYFKEGRSRMKQGKLDGAIEMFEAVLSKNESHTPSYLSLGMIYTRKNLLDLAIEAFESAVGVNKNLLAGQLLLGQSYAAKGLNQKAKEAFEQVIVIKPDYPRGHLLLGILYETEGNISEAMKRYRHVTSFKGKTAESKQAQNRIEILIKRGKLFFDEGKDAINTGDVAQAEDAFRGALEIDPDDTLILYYLGRISKDKNHMDEASSFLRRALEIKPDFLSARLFLGETYEAKGEFGRAIREYKTVRAAVKNPDDKNGKLARQKLKQIGETEGIAKIVQAFLRKGAEYLEKGELTKARTEFLVAVVFLPDLVYAHHNLGLIALLKGELRLAERRFKRVIQINPTHLPSRIGLGESYERQRKVPLALEAFREAARLYPIHEAPRLALAELYEKEERIAEALEVYHQVIDFTEEASAGKKVAQSRIDFYENRFHVDFSSTSITYDSNSNQTQQPVPEIESNVSLGLIYFLKKRERFRISLRLAVSTKLFHRTQVFFINEGISLVSLWNLPNYILVQGFDFDTGRSGGPQIPNEKSFSSTSYKAEVIKFRAIPSETHLHFDLQRLKLTNNPIFNSNKRTLRLSLFQNLKMNRTNFGRLGLSYTFLDNDINANDQRRRSLALSINYSRSILPSLSGTIGFTQRAVRFRHPDSLPLSRGEIQRRRNEFTSLNLGLSYQPQPGVSLFLGYVKQKNRSNLPTAASIDPLSLNVGQDVAAGADPSASIADGHVASLGDYERELFIFGASAEMDLTQPYPRWGNFQKQVSVALTVGYFRPSLKNLNAIIADPKRVIIQDPNHLLPSNPDFVSQDKNISTGSINGDLSNGVEIEWEMKPRHALVFSLSEWQNETVARDTVPLLLSPTGGTILVPRSARYNLAVNQVALTWRYSFFNEPGAGRFYMNIGLFGGAFSSLTIDSLMKVTNPPLGNPFASMGSLEARSTSFTTRFGFGGAFFIRSWLSLGLEANYLFAEAAKLEVKREFPASFSDLVGVQGLTPNACQRRADTRVGGDTLSFIDCEDDQVIERSGAKVLKLRLDGYDAKLILRFHFGEGIVGKTAFERLMGWDDEGEKKSLSEWLFPSSVRENLRINGVLKNETAYRIKQPISFTKSLFLFRLNSRYALSRQVSITARTRSFYDAIYDLVDIDTISPRRFPNTVLTQIPQNPTSEQIDSINIENSRSVDIVRHRFEFREVFLDINLKNVDFRIGRQIVRWGVVTGARVTDEINPFDFSEFILRETDDRFIPLMMLRTNYFHGDSRFELIWIPEIVPHRPAPKGSEFEQFEILTGFKPTKSFLDSDLSIHPEAFENSELGLRMMQSFNGFELSLTGFYTWDDFPTSFRSLSGNASGGFGGAVRAPDFFPEQRRIMIFGTTLSKSLGRFVVNAEYAYVFDKFFGTLLTIADINPTLGEAQRNYMKYAVSLDFTYGGVDLSFSFLQQYILHWNSSILQDRVDTVGSLFSRKAFMNERIVAQTLILYFINEDDILLRPLIETRLSDNVKFRFGADFFIGDRGERVGEFDFIGFFKDSDRFYLEIIRSF